MKEVTRCAAQGDVMFRRVKVIPDGYVRKEHTGEIVVAHSETGHNHVVRSDKVQWFGLDEAKLNDREAKQICYLQMGDVCDFTVEHLRSYDTHETLKMKGNPGDIWEVRRQREHTPEGWRQVQD
jgi:hypothetical protein